MPAKKLKPRPQVAVSNINAPKYSQRVDARKYAAMKAALLKTLPAQPPGLTQNEMRKAVRRFLPEHEFPGARAAWWSRCVQLDLEVKGIIVRDAGSRPLRWFKL